MRIQVYLLFTCCLHVYLLFQKLFDLSKSLIGSLDLINDFSICSQAQHSFIPTQMALSIC